MVLAFFFLRKVKMKSPDRVSQHFSHHRKMGEIQDDKRKEKEKENTMLSNLAGSRRLSLDFAAF